MISAPSCHADVLGRDRGLVIHSCEARDGLVVAAGDFVVDGAEAFGFRGGGRRVGGGPERGAGADGVSDEIPARYL